MAAARPHIYLLLLLSQIPQPLSALDRRFSDLKRCADQECSMLMCQGTALQDFTGPDCRFVNFKKDEPVHVYYKLAGRSTDLWAGTVGSNFGYFPKDLLDIKKVHTKDELELQTDETDFVCFDGGTDSFDNYNVDELLKKTEAPQKDVVIEETPPTAADEEGRNDNQKSQEVVEESTDGRNILEKQASNIPETTKTEDIDVPPFGKDQRLEDTLAKGDNPTVNSQSENTQEDTIAQKPSEEIVIVNPQVPDSEHAKNDRISQGEDSGSKGKNDDLEAYTIVNKDMLQNLKTQSDSSADAVVSDDEETRHVTQEDEYVDVYADEFYDEQLEEEMTEELDDQPLLTYDKSVEESKDEAVLSENEFPSSDKLEVKPASPEEEKDVTVESDETAVLKKDSPVAAQSEAKSATPEQEDNVSLESTKKSKDETASLENDTPLSSPTETKPAIIEEEVNAVVESVVKSSDGAASLEKVLPSSQSESKPAAPEHEDDVSAVKSKDEASLLEKDLPSSAQSEAKPANSEEQVQAPVEEEHAKIPKPEKDIVTTLGDAFFAIVSGGDYTKDVTDLDRADSEEESDEDDEALDEPNNDDSVYLLSMEKHKGRQSDDVHTFSGDNYDKLLKDLASAPDPWGVLETDQNIDTVVNPIAHDQLNLSPVDATFPKSDVDPELLVEKQNKQSIDDTEQIDIKKENVKEDNPVEKVRKDADDEPQQIETHAESTETKIEVHDAEKKMLEHNLDRDQQNIDVHNISSDALPKELEKSETPNMETKEFEDAQTEKKKEDPADKPADELPTASENEERKDPEIEKRELEDTEKLTTKAETVLKEDDKSTNVEDGKSINASVTEEVPKASDIETSDIETKGSEEIRKVEEDSENLLLEDGKLTSASFTGELPKVLENAKIDTPDLRNKEDKNIVNVDEADKSSTVSSNNEEKENLEAVHSEDIGDKVPSDLEAKSEIIDVEGEETPDDNVELLEDENAASAIRSDLAKRGNSIINSESLDKTKESVDIVTEEKGSKEEGTVKKSDENNEGNRDPHEFKEEKNAVEETKAEAITDPLKEEERTKHDDTESLNATESNTETTTPHSEDLSTKEIIRDDYIEHHIDEEDNVEQGQKDNQKVPDDSIDSGNDTPDEPDYKENIKELTIIKEYLAEEQIDIFRKYLGSDNVFKVESMFEDMDSELKLARNDNVRQDYTDVALDQILEASESNILDFVESILNTRELTEEQITATEKDMYDEESILLENIQEVAYRLRNKHSTFSDSSQLAPEVQVSEQPSDVKEEVPPMQTEDSETSVDQKPEEEKTLDQPSHLDNVETEKEIPSQDALPTVDPIISAPDETSSYEKEPEKDKPYGTEDVDTNLKEPDPSPQASPVETEDSETSLWQKPEEEKTLDQPSHLDEVETEQEIPSQDSLPTVDPIISALDETTSHEKEPEREEMLENHVESDEVSESFSASEIISTLHSAFLATKEHLDPVASTQLIMDVLEPEDLKSSSSPAMSMGPDTSLLDTFSIFYTFMVTRLLQLISALPEYAQPGPDFHGVQWEAVVITLLVGIITFLIFVWRTCLSVKSRVYQVTEKQLAEKIAALIKEKSEALEKISQMEQKIKEVKESETATQNKSSDLVNEAAALKATLKELKNNNKSLDAKMKTVINDLESQRAQNKKKQEMIVEGKKSIERLQEEFGQHTAELSELQIALNETKLKEQKVRSDLLRVQEENSRLKDRKEQLLKEAEGWSERQKDLDEQIKLQQKSHKDLEEALAYKENEIEVLTNCIMQLKHLEEDTAAGEDGGWQQTGDGELANGDIPDKRKEKLKMQIKQMMDVSRVKTTLSIIEEEKDLYQRKLTDEISARHDLEEQIKELQHDSSSLQSERTQLDNECKTLRQKVEILTELYQQKEMALQKKLTQEEYERQEKEQKLTMADEKAIHASEEVKIYKQRIQEMEDELQKTERSYKNQIASHEKKAHENWLSARTAERELTEQKRECSNLRQKLIEVNQKIANLQRPSIVKPTAGRPDQQPPGRRGALSRDGSFGPSPVSGGAPSPPMMMDAPGRSSSANLSRTDHSKGDLGGMDIPPGHRRPPPDSSGRTSAPVERSQSAAILNSGPRTSSPSMTVDGLPNPPSELNPPNESETSTMPASPLQSEDHGSIVSGSKGPPSFPGTPVMNSPASHPPSRPIGPPPPRESFSARSLPPPQIHGPPPGMRDFPPRPLLPPGQMPPTDPRNFVRGPVGPREFPPGPMPLHGPRDFPHGPPPPGAYPPGPPFPRPRDFPPGPPHPGAREFPPGPPFPGPLHPGARDFPPGPVPPGVRDFPPGSFPPPLRDFPPGSIPPGARDFHPMPPPGAREFQPGPPPPGAREFQPGPPPPGTREFPPGPPPPGVREFLPGPPPQGARDFMQGPPVLGVRNFPAGPQSFPGGSSAPEQQALPPGSHQQSQIDPANAQDHKP
ncbi:LOW QUALITY PROTEIN: transport and Golgi organization protein 1 homolog [Discoglossus pictus]